MWNEGAVEFQQHSIIHSFVAEKLLSKPSFHSTLFMGKVLRIYD